jgi:hypothetical protein
MRERQKRELAGCRKTHEARGPRINADKRRLKTVSLSLLISVNPRSSAAKLPFFSTRLEMEITKLALFGKNPNDKSQLAGRTARKITQFLFFQQTAQNARFWSDLSSYYLGPKPRKQNWRNEPTPATQVAQSTLFTSSRRATKRTLTGHHCETPLFILSPANTRPNLREVAHGNLRRSVMIIDWRNQHGTT